jgi:hypothetical protein
MVQFRDRLAAGSRVRDSQSLPLRQYHPAAWPGVPRIGMWIANSITQSENKRTTNEHESTLFLWTCERFPLQATRLRFMFLGVHSWFVFAVFRANWP